MDRNNRRPISSLWRSNSSSRQEDEDIDPHTIVSGPTPPAPASAQASAAPTRPTIDTGAGNGTRSNLQPPPPRYGPAGGSSRRRFPSVSSRRSGSVSSRRSYGPVTPDAASESETEYFPPLGTTPSALSRSSSFYGAGPPSTIGSESGRPTYERTRQPSIRIRRGSGGSTRQPPAHDYASESSDTDTGRRRGSRPRSVSQPIPAAQIYPDANIARYSRRVPQMALPRLTEEGSRPTLAELGIPPSPISPARSLPEEPLDEDDPRRPSVHADPGRRLTRKRKLSRLFWPGGSINRGSPAPPADTNAIMDPAHQHQSQAQSDEYGEELVDWLDIIGKPGLPRPLQVSLDHDRPLLTPLCH